jgi:hypothetical protein
MLFDKTRAAYRTSHVRFGLLLRAYALSQENVYLAVAYQFPSGKEGRLRNGKVRGEIIGGKGATSDVAARQMRTERQRVVRFPDRQMMI